MTQRPAPLEVDVDGVASAVYETSGSGFRVRGLRFVCKSRGAGSGAYGARLGSAELPKFMKREPSICWTWTC